MNEKIPRLEFIGAGLTAAAAAGIAGCDSRQTAPKPPLDERLTYDISQFQRTDPALLLYEEKTPIPSDLNEPSCLAIATGDLIYAGGDRVVRVFGSDGVLRSSILLTETPRALDPLSDGQLRVGLRDRWEVYNKDGARLMKTEPLGERVHITAIAHAGKIVFVADAGNRQVLRCDADGNIVSRITGFVIPSPYFHLAVGSEGVLWIANTGKHRIEAYTFEGQYETGWGQTAMNVEGFCGCCNPVYFARLPDGRFVTSEKGLTRIKVYDVKGKFECVVAGPEQLVKDAELARKACTNCQIGYGVPVACDSRGRVIALDPATKSLRIFTPKEKKT